MLDADAVRATQRLMDRGFEAYLVGGCVRDLLLGRTPKDYDIATEARPPQVKRTFPRNCRIIGRRFKLAHLHFHGNTKILECSTFRRTPQTDGSDDDLLITHDNEFGNAQEDAQRRDFTVNGLFFDPIRDQILDYTNGLQDVQARVIRTIGDPRVRFREDPVRILRAAKFAGRLGFSVEADTFAAMAETAGDLVRAAPPRVLEEILRLLRGGHALDSFQLLRDVGALKILVPVAAEFLQRARHDQRVAFWRLLEALDHRVQDGHVPPNGVLLGALLVCPVLAAAENNPQRSPSSIAEDVLGPLCAALRLPRRDAGCLKRICGVQHRFVQPEAGKRFRTAGFVHGPYFLEALDLFELRTLANHGDPDLVTHWSDLADQLHGHGHFEAEPFDGGAERDDAPEQRREDDDDGDPSEAPEADGEAATEAAPQAGNDDGSRRRKRRRRRGRRRQDDIDQDAPAAGSDEPTAAGDDDGFESNPWQAAERRPARQPRADRQAEPEPERRHQPRDPEAVDDFVVPAADPDDHEHDDHERDDRPYADGSDAEAHAARARAGEASPRGEPDGAAPEGDGRRRRRRRRR
ncbi:MAG: CCA tRNA nucleotidyltransferase, partial [Planctomycetes bacterium]|nr:CCA tRNA nucleotidyltransferase [Planctomycetota bacterium]